MSESLNPVMLSEEVKNKVIGWLVKNDDYFNLKGSDDAQLLEFHHSLGQWIRMKFIWNHYDENDNFVHPDDISYEWIVEIRDTINDKSFDIKEWINSHPEYLV